MAARRRQLMLFWLSLPTADLQRRSRNSRNKCISHLLYNFILNPSATALSNPFRVGSRGWGTLVHKNHAAEKENGSIMVGMFVSLCFLASKTDFFFSTVTGLR